jgi:SAM-dependent methyltransferase
MPAHDNETERIRRIYDRRAATAPSARGNANLRWLCGGAEGETLEVGIGRGRTLAFYPLDVRLTGIELSDVALEFARRRALELGIRPLCARATQRLSPTLTRTSTRSSSASSCALSPTTGVL